jgi:ribosomal protein S18 acetylase RimI-like enzyme
MTDGDTPAPRIRPAKAEDADSLGRLGALLVHEHHEFDPERFLAATGSTPQHYASFLASQIDDPRAVMLVAEHEDRVIGYAYGRLEGHDYMALRGPAAILHDVIVDAAYRDRGVGKALVVAMITSLAARAPRVVLSTAERNAKAQRFFERMGFRRTMVEMTKELP